MIVRALALAALLTAPVPALGQSPRVSTSEGGLVGVMSGGGNRLFLGVPFARPPVGDLRWRPPRPIQWTGERAATVAGPACLQSPLGWNNKDAARSSEDCLYLDVSTPTLDPAARRPVMVWIHGGANWAGSGDGVVRSNLARQGVVVVSVQYRLGVFGFLSHPALTVEGGGASGNYALMDLVAALRWVRDNIAAFGGDPDNVTLFGHSAGAQDVGLLMLSPLARGLYARGILQSGTPGFGLGPRMLAQNEAIGVALARSVGAAREGASRDAGLARLRQASGPALLTAAKDLTAPIADPGFIWTQAVVDGAVLPGAPDALLTQADGLAPMIVGSSAREIDLFGEDTRRARAWINNQSAGVADGLRKAYGLDRRASATADLPIRVATDQMFRCPGERVAAARTARGAKVWRYELEVPAPGATVVGHGSELAYVFDAPAGPPLQAYWLNFAKTGDPNGASLPLWPAYGEDRNYLAFTTKVPVTRRGLGQGACASLLQP